MRNTVTKSERLGGFINKNGYSIMYFTYQQHGLSNTYTTGSIWFKKNNSDGVRDDGLVSFAFYSTEYENLHSETEIKDFTDGLIFKGDNGELLGTNNNAGSGNLSSNNTNVFIPQTLNVDKQWGWMKLPWIYVNAINSWVYYTISGSTSLVYSNKYKVW